MIQQALFFRPETGTIIKSGGGLRKIRWKTQGSSKRGGFRFIYYWDTPGDTIYMLLIYRKSKQENLSSNQLKTLRTREKITSQNWRLGSGQARSLAS